MTTARCFAQNMNASAQSACAPSVCPGNNNSIIIILDAALLASIFAALVSSLLLGEKIVHTDRIATHRTASVPA